MWRWLITSLHVPLVCRTGPCCIYVEAVISCCLTNAKVIALTKAFVVVDFSTKVHYRVILQLILFWGVKRLYSYIGLTLCFESGDQLADGVLESKSSLRCIKLYSQPNNHFHNHIAVNLDLLSSKDLSEWLRPRSGTPTEVVKHPHSLF